MAPILPTKNGGMQEDQYWILKYQYEWEFSGTFKGCRNAEIVPVTCESVTIRAWSTAPELAVKQAKIGDQYAALSGRKSLLNKFARADRYLGRRINDEIELFDEDREEEFSYLRQSLEEKGLTVRSYVPQKEVKKFPKLTHKAIMGGEKNTLIKKCMEHLEAKIAKCFFDTGIEFGFIADFPIKKVRTLAVERVDEDLFFSVLEATSRDEVTLPIKNDYVEFECKILGEVRGGEPRFWCNEEEAKSYFDSLGRVEEFIFIDKIVERQRAEKAALQVQKKQEKKHRRQVTASTVTSPSENSFASLPQEDDEVAKARQREKHNAKRKMQKERRKAKAAEEYAAEDSPLDNASRRDSHQEGEDGKDPDRDENTQSEDDHFELLSVVGNTFLCKRNGELIIKNTLDVGDIKLSTTKINEDTKRHSLRADSSSSSSDSTENDFSGLDVVHAEDTSAIKRILRRGDKFLLLSPVDDTAEVFQTQLLGRGL